MLVTTAAAAQSQAGNEWPAYGGDLAATKFSIAHRHQSRATSRSSRTRGNGRRARRANTAPRTRPGNFQATPLMIGDTLFLSTSYNRVVALDANTGRELWSYDPKAYLAGQPPNGTGFVHRGVATWTDGKQRRIFMNSRWNLIALDAATGKPIRDFGDTGVVDLTRELGRNGKAVNKLHYTQTSPPVVWRNLVIVGNGVADELIYPNDPPGDVQAFDVKSGKRVWSFSPVPRGREGRRRGIVGERVVADRGTHERVGAVQRRRSPRADLSAGEHAEQRLVRRRAKGKRSLRGIDRLPRREERKTRLVFPDRASRSLGLRPSRGAGARDGARRRTLARHRRRPDEDGISLRLRSRGRHADLADRGALGAGERRARRGGGAVAAVSDQTQAVRQAGIRLQRSDRLHAGDQVARARRDQGLRVGPLFTPPSMDGTIVMPGAIGGAGWGGGAFDPTTGTIYIKATNQPALYKIMQPTRSDTLDADYTADFGAQSLRVIDSVRATAASAFALAADQQAAVRNARRDRSQHRRPEVERPARRHAGNS